MPGSNATWVDSSRDRLDALTFARKTEADKIGPQRFLAILVPQHLHKLAQIVLEAGFGVILLHHGRQCHLYTGRPRSLYDTVVLGPIVVAYQFAQAGQYVEAGAIALLATTWYVVGGRAVIRGEFGPATVFTVLGLGAIILFVAVRFRH